MAITSRDLRSSEAVRRPRPTTVITIPHSRRRASTLPSANAFVYLVTLIMALFVANALLSPIVSWVGIKYDDMKYGRPRTVQMSAFVGHDEGNGLASHFVAMNLDRRVVIMEMPGGDPVTHIGHDRFDLARRAEPQRRLALVCNQPAGANLAACARRGDTEDFNRGCRCGLLRRNCSLATTCSHKKSAPGGQSQSSRS